MEFIKNLQNKNKAILSIKDILVIHLR